MQVNVVYRVWRVVNAPDGGSSSRGFPGEDDEF